MTGLMLVNRSKVLHEWHIPVRSIFLGLEADSRKAVIWWRGTGCCDRAWATAFGQETELWHGLGRRLGSPGCPIRWQNWRFGQAL